MLKNLNAGIIRRLAANSLKSDKKRNLFRFLFPKISPHYTLFAICNAINNLSKL